MPAKRGRTAQIVAYVTAHPGCMRADLLAAVGLDVHNAMPTYCLHTGLIFKAGPRCSQRYYPTAQLAMDADALVRAEVKAQRARLKAEAHRKANLRRRARRHAAGGKVVNSRPGQCVEINVGAMLSCDVRLTPAKPTPSRWTGLIVPETIKSAEARPWAHACAEAMGAV